MRLQEENSPAQNTGRQAKIDSAYSIFLTLLAAFGNACFVWICFTMHRKAHPQSPEQLLTVGCIAAAVLAVLAPAAWLWHSKQERQDGPMPPAAFMKYTSTSHLISWALVALSLMLFFQGAPVAPAASVPAAALGFDLLVLLPWVIKDKLAWSRR